MMKRAGKMEGRGNECRIGLYSGESFGRLVSHRTLHEADRSEENLGVLYSAQESSSNDETVNVRVKKKLEEMKKVLHLL